MEKNERNKHFKTYRLFIQQSNIQAFGIPEEERKMNTAEKKKNSEIMAKNRPNF